MNASFLTNCPYCKFDSSLMIHAAPCCRHSGFWCIHLIFKVLLGRPFIHCPAEPWGMLLFHPHLKKRLVQDLSIFFFLWISLALPNPGGFPKWFTISVTPPPPSVKMLLALWNGCELESDLIWFGNSFPCPILTHLLETVEVLEFCIIFTVNSMLSSFRETPAMQVWWVSK